MALLNEAIFDELVADAAVLALVVARVYPGIAPQAVALPYITYHKLSNEHEHHMGGGAGLATARMQISAWDDSDLGAETLADAIREALDSFRGALGTGDTVDISRFHLDSDTSTHVDPVHADDVAKHMVALEFDVTYTETIT